MCERDIEGIFPVSLLFEYMHRNGIGVWIILGRTPERVGVEPGCELCQNRIINLDEL